MTIKINLKKYLCFSSKYAFLVLLIQIDSELPHAPVHYYLSMQFQKQISETRLKLPWVAVASP